MFLETSRTWVTQEFTSGLAGIWIETDSIETYVDQFEDEIERLLHKHAPIKETKCKFMDLRNRGLVRIFIT